MDWDKLRRIVTDTQANGRSTVLLDGGPANALFVEENGLAEIWSMALGADLHDGDDKLAVENVTLEPDAGCAKVRWFTVPVEDGSKTPEQQQELAAFGFAAVQAAHARIDTTRHPAMHKTDSLDVIVLVHGNVDLLLDDGEARKMKPGDVVIQRATNHAWVNRGSQTALLVAVLINTGKA